MLTPPDLPPDSLRDCLKREYGLDASSVTFLPLGADVNTAVYCATAGSGACFVKLRRGDFDPYTVRVPHLLADSGVPHLIPPVPSESGSLWTPLHEYNVVVYPFVEGKNGYDLPLTIDHWEDLGRALRGLHDAALPPELLQTFRRETYSAHWRDLVRSFQARIVAETLDEPAAAALATLLTRQAHVVSDLVHRAERMAAILRVRDTPFVLCHGDIHAWNVLISKQGQLYLVDWDTMILAPRERDLMFIGGGLGWQGESEETEARFYRGYGSVEVDAVALAYYRYERIVEDIAAYCEQLLLSTAGGADRWEAMRQISGQFEPGDVIDVAYRTDRTDAEVYRV